jgi:putative tryptophan/tyrosine transport system substrate-binding protein
MIRRREFIAGLGAAAWPIAARAQRAERVRRVGYLSYFAERDSLRETYFAAFRQEMQNRGWIEGRNLQIESRFGAVDIGRTNTLAPELVQTDPEVILAFTRAAVVPLLQKTKSIPIVFVGIGDPYASGFVQSLARPEGNLTGFTNLLFSIAGKWLERLKEAAPHITRVALLLNQEFIVEGYVEMVEAVAPALSVRVIKTPYRNSAELESAIAAFAEQPNGGLIVMPASPSADTMRLIYRLAERHRLPAMYETKGFAMDGGLMSYGLDWPDMFRNAATYVDRILRGAKIADLPIQQPTKFEMVINLKAAKAIRLAIPQPLLVLADEVIE